MKIDVDVTQLQQYIVFFVDTVEAASQFFEIYVLILLSAV